MTRIHRPGHNCWSLERADEACLLVDALEYYRAFHRVARTARRHILIAGWQFDSDVPLVRGDDLAEVDGPVAFLAFLNDLCEHNPALEVRILGWDYSIVYVLERQWFQKLVFAWTTHARVVFRTDAYHPVGASHHQKFVVVDGETAFLGGTDICAHRWDDRRHLAHNPERQDGGVAYGPYHEVQAALRGPVVDRLVELFRTRWRNAGGGDLELPAPERREAPPLRCGLPMPRGEVALSRTQGANVVPLQEQIVETRNLFVDAIDAAESLIYLETQYFSAQAVYAALEARMRRVDRPRIEIVLILPSRAWALLEALAVGLTQDRLLAELRARAAETSTPLGIYCTAPPGSDEREATFIHSKVLAVDDRMLLVGSANATNRSMGLDTELNVSWEAAPDDRVTERAIRRARVSLLAEHSGATGPTGPTGPTGRTGALRALASTSGLVATLDRMAALPGARLRLHGSSTDPRLAALAPEGLGFDPAGTLIEEELFEAISSDGDSVLARGVTLLNRLLLDRRR